MNAPTAIAFVLAGMLAASLVPILPASAQTVTEVIMPRGSQSPSAAVFYDPDPVTVAPGSAIVWVNQDTALHTATSGNAATGEPDGIFDSGFISPNRSSEPITMPSDEGEYPYYCVLHPFMVGTVIVSASAMNGNGEPMTSTATTILDGESYAVAAISTDTSVTGLEIVPNESVHVQFAGPGVVELILPTSMISGVSEVSSGGSDISFETVASTGDSTTIRFTVPASGEVEIRGAVVVPEFGVIAALVLATSLVAVVGLARFKGNLFGFGRL